MSLIYCKMTLDLPEQLPMSLPSHVSFFLATHSLPKVWLSFLVVQHFEASQILTLMSSSDPAPPIWTSIFLKVMLGTDDNGDDGLEVGLAADLAVVDEGLAADCL